MIIPSILHGTGVAVLAATLLIGSALQIGTLLGKAPATPIFHYATITVTRSITPDGEYNNSYTCTGEPGLVTALGMLTWAQHAIAHSAYHPTGEPDD